MKKIYYSIGEVSRITGVKAHVLRYWEDQFKELSPEKNRGGKRIYTQKDIEVVLKLKELIKDQKYSTAGAKKVITRNPDQEADPTLPVAVQRDLKEIKILLSNLMERI